MSDRPPDEITDDELLFRSVSVKSEQYDPASGYLHRAAFQVYDRDKTGLSVTRGRSERHPEFLSVEEEAARGTSSDGYYVVVLRAGDVKAAGIEIVPAPVDGNPGHAELPQMHASNRRSNETKERMQLLADIRLRVDGPFDSNGKLTTPAGGA